MTSPVSRRQLASYATTQLLAGKSPKLLATELAAVLASLGRQSEAELLISDVIWELEKAGKLARAKVTSAAPLSAKLCQQLAGQVKDVAKVDVVAIEEEIDKQVIGGVRIETAGRAWDFSVAHGLKAIREMF